MGKVLAILLGLGAMAGGVYLVVAVWWVEFRDLIFGCIPPILFLGGLIAFVAGFSSLKDSSQDTDENFDGPEEEKTE